MKYILLFFIISLGCTGCDSYPKDTEDTLAKITGNTLVVGYSENPPWVVATDSGPTGIEPELIKAFAKTLPTKLKWKKDTEQNLMEDLEHREVHLVVAGITDDSPWKTHAGFTRPFVKQGKKKHVMAAINGENAFIIRLEQFLIEQESQIKNRVQP